VTENVRYVAYALYCKPPSYERALPHLFQLNGDVITLECSSSNGMDLPLFTKYRTDKKIDIGVISDCVSLVEDTNIVRHELGLPEARARASDDRLWFAG